MPISIKINQSPKLRRAGKRLIKVGDSKRRFCPDCVKRLYRKPNAVDTLFCAMCGEEFALDDTPVQTRIVAASQAKPILISRKNHRPLDADLSDMPDGATIIDKSEDIRGR